MDYKGKITSDDTLLQDIGQYRRLVGRLIYLTIIRPDIAYTISYVSQFIQASTVGHMGLIDQILCYLKTAPRRGILMKNHNHTEIVGYIDVDWAENPTDRRSTTGYCTFVGGNIVTWKSKKQNVVACSSAEAEYRAMAYTTCEVVWLKLLLQELHCNSINSPIKLFCDNQATCHIAANPVFHERTKHIEVDCHFIPEKIQGKIIETPYIRSKDQLADIFTKALSKNIFQEFASKLTSDDIFAPT
ncbi:hypothetical protein CFOL_v3_07308 [Cephalotus follicularis]|uniref:Copia protein n=1 Tax=Cephalotus follicularis TaxID=3775 RepID=A0A1Q3B767_CEPFO|nr:hypothetical protein CFOL_v3_07308 [Cephalotus follicularis]